MLRLNTGPEVRWQTGRAEGIHTAFCCGSLLVMALDSLDLELFPECDTVVSDWRATECVAVKMGLKYGNTKGSKCKPYSERLMCCWYCILSAQQILSTSFVAGF